MDFDELQELPKLSSWATLLKCLLRSVTSSNVDTFKNYRQHYVISRHGGGLLGDVGGREGGVGEGGRGGREEGREG